MIAQDAPFALVVDDEALIRLGACDILEDAGFNCLDAADADEGLGILERRNEDIVLLFTDVDLGDGIDGFELAAITAMRWPHVGILVASGASVPKDGQLPDCATFIGKPFSAEVVHGRLQELLPEGQKPESLKQKAR